MGQVELEDRKRKTMFSYNVYKHSGWRCDLEVILTDTEIAHVGHFGSFQFRFPNTYVALLVSQLSMCKILSQINCAWPGSHIQVQLLLSFLGWPKLLHLAFPTFTSLIGTSILNSHA